MRWFKNIKMVQKLMVVFSIICTFMIGMGVFSIMELQRVAQSADDIVKNWMPNIVAASDMNTNTSDYRIAEMQHVFSPTPEEKAKYEKDMAAIFVGFEKNRADYEVWISSDIERSLYEGFRVKWAAYLKTHEGLVTLSRENKTEEAKALLRGDLQKLFDDASADLLKIININVSGAKQTGVESAEAYSSARILIIVASGLGVVLAVLLAIFLSKLIGGQLRVLVSKVETVASGNLTVEIQQGSQDEIGELFGAFGKMVASLRTIIADVTGSTVQLASAAEEMSAVTEQTSRGMGQQQAETDQIATAMNEMSATVQEVARNAAAAAQSAHQADDQASKGKQVVSQTIESIDALATEVEKAGQVIHKLEGDSVSIGAVLDVIKGIAEQTNLLALNAAIEAARAGEQGRGFAVVADEVRTLAQRTQQSTQEIRKMIESLQSGAKDAVKVMVEGKRQAQVSVEQAAKAGAALETITRAVATITDMNTQIASAAEEQSAVAEEMNRNIVNISQVANQTAEGGQQTASGAADVAQLAVRLQAAVGRFRL